MSAQIISDKKDSMRKKFPEGPPSWDLLPLDVRGDVDLAKLKLKLRKVASSRPASSPQGLKSARGGISARLEAAWERREAQEEAFVERARQSYTQDFDKDRKWKKIISVSPLVQQRIERQKQWTEILVCGFLPVHLFARLKIIKEENEKLSLFDDVKRKYLARTSEHQRLNAWKNWKFVLNIFRLQMALTRYRRRSRGVYIVSSFLAQAIKLGELKRNCFRLISRVKKMQRLCRTFARLKKTRIDALVTEWRKHEETVLKKHYQTMYKSQASAAVTARLWRSKRVSEAAVREILRALYVQRARKYSADLRKWRHESRTHLKYEIDLRKFIQTLQKNVAMSKPKVFDENPGRKYWELTDREWKDLINKHIKYD